MCRSGCELQGLENMHETLHGGDSTVGRISILCDEHHFSVVLLVDSVLLVYNDTELANVEAEFFFLGPISSNILCKMRK